MNSRQVRKTFVSKEEIRNDSPGERTDDANYHFLEIRSPKSLAFEQSLDFIEPRTSAVLNALRLEDLSSGGMGRTHGHPIAFGYSVCVEATK